ncbi:hypothetical protein KEM10_22835 [Carboxylicivirga linearis]|uniref:Uncharacterized protein n=1 Tax=Carboxylicivirga linearis TaxID=1628157 RepID=A0ABS5K214_9BACT|nr:hypothetical protein [Carboxylicivirga linearis]
MIISKSYSTKLSVVEIDNWIKSKTEERLKNRLLKPKRFKAKLKQSIFMIREIRQSQYDSFKPRIIGRFLKSTNHTVIKINIFPSISGTLLFSIFIIVVPTIILSSGVTINNVLATSLMEKIKVVGVIWLIGIPTMYFSLIRPIYRTQKWLESELELRENLKK